MLSCVAAIAITLGVGSAVPAVASPAGARPSTASAAPAADRADLRRALDAVVAGGATSAIARVRDEHGEWSAASGVGDRRTGRPADPNGRFRVGSVTKTFVSTVLLQLVGEHRLGLDDSIERWLPGLLPNGQGITVRQILGHTSGIYNFTDDAWTAEWVKNLFRHYEPRDLIAYAVSHPPLFPPGTGWSYSNTNYLVAGLLAERVTGHPLRQELQARLFGPLRLAHTSYPGDFPLILGPNNRGYEQLAPTGPAADVTELNPSPAGSAGAIVSDTEDLSRFYAALLDGHLLPPDQLAQMETMRDTGNAGIPRYGLGLASPNLRCGLRAFGHDGGIPGYSTVTLRSADGARQIVISISGPTSDAVYAAAAGLVDAAMCPSA
ncbi:beta-lactamase family protein [Solihabitans fulvus]|uniref:Beta-lactamase family protein n=1 Tax=Solihabitans fulvus TaxID=1892852 RepID=A0A5B2XG12_9PSEU|nr:serine hydrolase domain-containing protein [Solihabitans fulvus]KAA2261975.1 beta-lactamase family protein [Solihabitans fulvus]